MKTAVYSAIIVTACAVCFWVYVSWKSTPDPIYHEQPVSLWITQFQNGSKDDRAAAADVLEQALSDSDERIQEIAAAALFSELSRAPSLDETEGWRLVRYQIERTKAHPPAEEDADAWRQFETDGGALAMITVAVRPGVGAEKHVGFLLANLSYHDSSRPNQSALIRSKCAYMLARLGADRSEVRNALLSAIQDPRNTADAASPAVCSALSALSTLFPDDEKVVGALVDFIGANSGTGHWFSRRLAAIDALSHCGPRARTAVPFLVNCLERGADERGVTARVIWKLDPTMNRTLVQALLQDIRNGSASNSGALALLREMGPAASDAVPELIKALGQKSPLYRRDVIWTLEVIDPAGSRGHIAACLNDREEFVRTAAKEALQHIDALKAPDTGPMDQ